MKDIAAVIITRNEAHNIGRCLASLQGVVDEVVVVDAQSTDETPQIASSAGARVITRAWTDYADQKNFANDQVAASYILSLDADEVLSPELNVSLRIALDQGLHGAYSMSRLTNYCGSWVRHGGWYPDIKVRIFPKMGTRWVGTHVHETLELMPGTTISHLHGDLLHYSYHTVADHLARIERYSDLHALKLHGAGKRSGLKRWFSPIAKFISGYVFRLGFLDGRAGWTIAKLSARAVRLKYVKLDRLYRARNS
jgi:glycosyltransferase involved in cell wall biosynthesis